jgi:hypothetical protein
MLVFPVAVHAARYYDDLAIKDARATPIDAGLTQSAALFRIFATRRMPTQY